MRVLLLHPDDRPWSGEWANTRWDLIVDLGFAGKAVYDEWSVRTGARVISLHQFAGEMESYRFVKEVLEPRRGRLLDRMGLDWWELIAVWSYQRLQALHLVRSLRHHLCSAKIEWFATRTHASVEILRHGLGETVHYFCPSRRGVLSTVPRIFRAASRLRANQIAEIAFDKWDASYSLRRRISRRARCEEPIWLLPSAYSNVTRILLAYAAQLPEHSFLLTVTRNDAKAEERPSNVSTTSLAAYARPADAAAAEVGEMLARWDALAAKTAENDELAQAFRAGIFDCFPAHLSTGLRIRDAWRTLLEEEPVEGVLCGDDLNYYTRLPLLLARRMGRRAIYCFHGALDGGMLFKHPFADSHLVKGEMERDYMLRTRAVSPNDILVAAPGALPDQVPACEKSCLVFFSEPYEISGGRAEEIYRELLPRLCTLAKHSGRRLVIKLHPFESDRARRRLLKSILAPAERDLIDLVSRIPAERVISRAWCGVGIDSSVAVECTLRGVPYFICGWLSFNGFGYAQQFAKFGAGRWLRNPEDIGKIPALISTYQPSEEILGRLWHEGELDQIFEHRQAYSQCAS